MIRVMLLFFAVVTVVSGQFLQCPWVATLDCTRYPVKYLCGTDLVSYENSCDFAKSHCKDNNLNILGEGGTCGNLGFVTKTAQPVTVTTVDSTSSGTTAAPGPTTTHNPIFLGHNVVLDFFCLELMHEKCTDDTEMVCGNDTNTYENYCEFEKARCTHRSLDVHHYGHC